MALITNVENFLDCKVEYSLNNGVTWTNITDYVTSVQREGGDRMTGEAYTFGASTAITKVGKRQPETITLRMLYTEDSGSPARVAEERYASGEQFMVRWFPESGNTGELGYQTHTDARIVNHPVPVGDAETATPNMVEVQVRTSFVERVAAT